MDIQLREEIHTNDHGQDGDRTTIQCCGNCGKLKYNVCIYKKD